MDIENISSTSDTISPSLRRSTRISLTQAEHVRYDTKYHPLDEAIRPKTAAKRRSVYGAPRPKEIGSDIDVDSADEESDQTLDAASSDSGTEAEVEGEEEEEEEVQAQHAPRSPPRGERHSSRIAAKDSPFSYSQKQHPQDALLRSAGVIGRGRKRSAPSKSIVTRRRASTGSVAKKRKRHTDNRRATLAKSTGVTINDYAAVYTQAREMVGQTEQERSFNTLQKNYVNAWENLTTVTSIATKTPSTPNADETMSVSSNSIAADESPNSSHAAQNDGSDLATSLGGLTTAPSRSPNCSVLLGSPRNSSKQNHSRRWKAKKPNFEIYEDSTTHDVPPSNGFVRDEDKENDCDPDARDERPATPPRRLSDISPEIHRQNPVSSNNSQFRAARGFLDRVEPSSGQRSVAHSNVIDQLSSKRSLDGAEDTESEDDGDSSVGNETLRQASPEL